MWNLKGEVAIDWHADSVMHVIPRWTGANEIAQLKNRTTRADELAQFKTRHLEQMKSHNEKALRFVTTTDGKEKEFSGIFHELACGTPRN